MKRHRAYSPLLNPSAPGVTRGHTVQKKPPPQPGHCLVLTVPEAPSPRRVDGRPVRSFQASPRWTRGYNTTTDPGQLRHGEARHTHLHLTCAHLHARARAHTHTHTGWDDPTQQPGDSKAGHVEDDDLLVWPNKTWRARAQTHTYTHTHTHTHIVTTKTDVQKRNTLAPEQML